MKRSHFRLSLPENIFTNQCIANVISKYLKSDSLLDELRAFPLAARREAGHQLDQVQNGQEPDDWKPMTTVGHGVAEIRIRDESGAFRVVYVAKFPDAIYVLHCFQKKWEKTSKADVDLAARRYRDLLKELDR